jgi:hypothetical protein
MLYFNASTFNHNCLILDFIFAHEHTCSFVQQSETYERKLSFMPLLLLHKNRKTKQIFVMIHHLDCDVNIEMCHFFLSIADIDELDARFSASCLTSSSSRFTLSCKLPTLI